jgi:hypothetical protein
VPHTKKQPARCTPAHHFFLSTPYKRVLKVVDSNTNTRGGWLSGYRGGYKYRVGVAKI